VQPDALDPAHAKRQACPLVLKTPELALDCATAAVERLWTVLCGTE
jgi:hypothetical protein